uniref:Uncharacterized protein n=1 Tax=Sphaeramia orbicularis TaxID=375764 RepID=A0A672YXE5_9TELE
VGGLKKWHILLTLFFLLITSGQCMDNKEIKQKETRTLLDLILQVIRDSQQRDKAVSRRCNSGLFTAAQDMKFSSREKPFYVPRLDNSRLIGNDGKKKSGFLSISGTLNMPVMQCSVSQSSDL